MSPKKEASDAALAPAGLLSQAGQVSLPFLAAGFGMVLAGTVLDAVQDWGVFRDTRELFILVPGGIKM